MYFAAQYKLLSKLLVPVSLCFHTYRWSLLPFSMLSHGLFPVSLGMRLVSVQYVFSNSLPILYITLCLHWYILLLCHMESRRQSRPCRAGNHRQWGVPGVGLGKEPPSLLCRVWTCHLPCTRFRKPLPHHSVTDNIATNIKLRSDADYMQTSYDVYTLG